LAVVEPLGIRLFGVEINEHQLNLIARALGETFSGPQPTLSSKYPIDTRPPLEKIKAIADVVLKFGDLVMEDERLLLDSKPGTLQDLLSKSGVDEHKEFMAAFLDNVAKKKRLVRMLTSLSSVSIGKGSIAVRFRNKMGEVEELKINLKKMWAKVREQADKIKNSFSHLAELALGEASQIIIHSGIYAAAFVLLIVSLWTSIAYSLSSGLSTIASSAVNALKASFPILSFVVWLFCTLVTISGGYSKAKDAYEAAKRFLGK
jgi:hypothetical protein